MRGGRYQSSQIGYGWQRCACAAEEEGQPAKAYPYIQWQIIQSGTTRLFLAVDTSCGDPEVGYFCEATSLTKDFVIRLEGMLDMEQQAACRACRRSRSAFARPPPRPATPSTST